VFATRTWRSSCDATDGCPLYHLSTFWRLSPCYGTTSC
jgi:hypothetical protein